MYELRHNMYTAQIHSKKSNCSIQLIKTKIQHTFKSEAIKINQFFMFPTKISRLMRTNSTMFKIQ